MRRSNLRTRCRLWLLLLPWLFPGSVEADPPPRIVRVRVPASKVDQYFPAGTPVTSLPLGEFEALARAADAPAESKQTTPRILRAVHEARWSDGVLIGESEFQVEKEGQRPAFVPLEPWTPAVDVLAGGPQVVRTDPSGRIGLLLENRDSGPIRLTWRVRARPGSDGKVYLIGLPRVPIGALRLELPEGLVPDGLPGIRSGPEPGSRPATRRWRFDDARGAIELRLRPAGASVELNGTQGIWGTSETDVIVGDRAVEWRSDWKLDMGASSGGRLLFELDPRLEPLQVTGDGVLSFETQKGEGRTLLRVRIADPGRPTTVALRMTAMSSAPESGNWSIPSARLAGGTWTGGQLTLRSNASREILRLRERNGRRVQVKPEKDRQVYRFESFAEGSVAEVDFGSPSVESGVSIRGMLLLGESVPRIDARVDWSVTRGSIQGGSISLPKGWAVERFASEVPGESLSWNLASSPDGSPLLVWSATIGPGSKKGPFRLVASAPGAGILGMIDVPRLYPANATVVEDRWIAVPGPTLRLRPAQATGLDWIESDLATLGPVPPDSLRGAIAWQWLSGEGGLRVERSLATTPARSQMKLSAELRKGRLHCNWDLEIDGGASQAARLTVFTGDLVPGPIRWIRPAQSSPGVEVNPLPESRRAEEGIANDATAWEITLGGAIARPVRLRAEMDVPWNGEGVIPILRLPESVPTLSTVRLRSDMTLRPSVRATGLERMGTPPIGGEEPIRSVASASLDQDFIVTEPTPQLSVTTSPTREVAYDPIVDEAILRTVVHGAGPRRSDLFMLVSPGDDRPLKVRSATGQRLIRCVVDGRAFTPPAVGGWIEIPMPSDGPRRDHVVELRYRSDADANQVGGASEDIRPDLPEIAAVCRSFVWELDGPAGRSVGGVPPGWWVESYGGVTTPAWFSSISRGRPGPVADDPATVASKLEIRQRLAATPRGLPLGDMLIRLSTENRPLRIDRLALAATGTTPNTRPAEQPAGAGPPESLADALRPFGLAERWGDGQCVITTLREATRPIPTPGFRRRPTASAEFETNSLVLVDDWIRCANWNHPIGDVEAPFVRLARLYRSGWPQADEPGVRLVDPFAGWPTVAGTTVGLFSLALALARRSRRLPLVILLAVALGGMAGDDDQLPWIGQTGVSASIAMALLGIYWAGGAFVPRDRAGIRSRLTPSASGRSATSGRLAVLLVAVLFPVPNADCQSPPPPGPGESPIVALYPYEGMPDPDQKPDRVLLRRSDYLRLRDLAAAASRPVSFSPTILASAAGHRVTRPDPMSVAVESAFDLWVRGPGPEAWICPIGGATDLSATVDGQPADVLISEDARNASIRIRGAGLHQLRFRRQLPIRDADGSLSIDLPIGLVANAQLQVEKSPDFDAADAEVEESQGPVAVESGRIQATLGPIGRIAVRFPSRRGRAEAKPARVDAVVLWDATPAGDRSRIRLKVRDPGSSSSMIAFRLDKGIALKSSRIPGVVDLSREDLGDRGTVWRARVAPPISRDAALELELWRPRLKAPAPIASPLPLVLGDAEVRGLIGLRRPGDWIGRLSDPAEMLNENVEEAFVEAWGDLPDEPLTLAGAAHWNPNGPVVADLVRNMPNVEVATSGRITPENGRLLARFDTVLSDPSGIWGESRFRLPVGFDVWRVEGDLVSGWSRLEDGEFSIRLGPGPRTARVRILGSLAAPTDGIDRQVRRFRAELPWPRWAVASEANGTLVMPGDHPLQVEPQPVPADISRNADGSIALTVRPGTSTGTLSWSSDPPRVDIEMANRLFFSATRVQWSVSLKLNLSGGPLDLFFLEIPRAWSGDAQLAIIGMDRQVTAETRGDSTYWAIRPSRPIWGQATIVLRGSQPIETGVTVDVPKLTPRGRGGVKSTLGVWNLSGRELITEGSSGLTMIAPGDLIQPAEAAGLPSSPGEAYRVSSERWRLQIHPGASRLGITEPSLAASGPARHRIDLDPWDRVVGDSTFHPDPRSGEEFRLQLPAGVRVVRASLGSRPVPSTLSDAGDFRVRIPESLKDPVRVVWTFDPNSSSPAIGTATPIAIPTPGGSSVGTSSAVELVMPPEYSASVSANSTERIQKSAFLYQILDLDALALAGELGDRADFTEPGRARLARRLVNLELGRRDLERSLATDPAGERLRNLARLRLDEVREALESAGLDAIGKDVAWSLGREATRPAGSQADPVRALSGSQPVPPRGDRAWFLAEGQAPASIVAVRDPVVSSWTETASGVVLRLLLAATAVAFSHAPRVKPVGVWLTRGAMAVLLLVTAVALPWATVPVIMLALAGRKLT